MAGDSDHLWQRKADGPLRICLMTYRGNPTCGGQGVYIQYLSRALKELGHEVDVLSGPPYPELAEGVSLHKIPGLDLYNPEHLFKVRKIRDLSSLVNQFEFISMCSGGFPEPFTFGIRAHRHLRKQKKKYDIVHDNQSLSYGLLGIVRSGYPTVATIHHPITVDRDTEIAAAGSWLCRMKVRRWYAFLTMQKRVSRKIPKIITVSECSKRDIGREFRIPAERFRVVPNGINLDCFYPMNGVRRADDQILVTNSADTPLKGLRYLLEAVAEIRRERKIRLVVIGKPKTDGVIEHLIAELSLGDAVRFTGRITHEAFARHYAEATMAVIPSLYEGFGMPAGEAMACGVPVISTTGGALPEVVGDAGILVPPANKSALKEAILALLNDPERRRRLSEAGLARVNNSLTWRHAALKTVEVYREAIDAYRRF
ncbi:MAG: glycosyltransferase family 1 protein [Syntrophobacterales bacterium CG_4_8_14_3_um_filter_58_8]|nr:MAG: glycosyltransferase family 1 protein [Syntrophobacterales bacterium CG03_land_8_20_14_0_80_58_14]PJC72263.1 MAG: glycosyltransferase family 1 protein [Syntrophobacterales bacterium CG_4_8_14_3_um_filter_58_8]